MATDPPARTVPAAPAPGGPSAAAANPYSTGGGGVTFEQRIGAGYLALMLTGGGAQELGEDRAITSVAFQQKPHVAVDDLVIRARRPDEVAPSLELAVGIRRAPKIEPSDEDTRKLVIDYLRALSSSPTDGSIERRWALVVAGCDTTRNLRTRRHLLCGFPPSSVIRRAEPRKTTCACPALNTGTISR